MLKTTLMASCLSLSLLTGCVATRKHVKSVSDPLDRRLGGLEAKTTEIDKTLLAHEKGISGADERAKGADDRAAEAAKEAARAHERIGKVGEQAETANKNAMTAKSVADQGLGKSTELEQRVAHLDDFQVLASHSVLFQSSKSALSEESQKQLDEAAAAALKAKRYVIEVQGFTDHTGPASANLVLSRQRADEVVRYLTLQHKIPLYRIYQLGSGALVPVADNKTREGRQQNRRVEVKVYSADSDGRKVTAQVAGGR